ncbi:sensor histidine kinase [Flavobacterium urocaniciphilum]|uniref:histidine kinase n=1 Tax=Flavobacterium urocaniciphilum TaxID=1299341 RepID=A0A1H9DT85_9FLAO|nr:ATP-binding protein [Flavobacterium urocaniciphilum]SEQ16527.1 two-component system, OmpR family, phosphate regulon sensor histidine kinase PhoR [Flavobacterium urocaniciphilum]
MAINFNKSYKFAFISSFYISIFVIGSLLMYHFFIENISLFVILIFPITLFLFSFYLIQYRVENFIYKRIKKLYDEVSILDATSLSNKTVTTDITTLTKDIRNFAKEKKIEIESLNIREEYRREFLGNISHELKTPLFTVQGYLDTLIDGGAIKDKTLRVKYIERASKGVERLISIVQDLDMISKFEVGDLNLEMSKFNIVSEIQNVFDMLEMKADQKNIILMFDEKYSAPIYVEADKERIQQVLTNLVMNSIKYGKENGTTEVSLEKINKNKVLIRIHDNGIGIEKHNLSRIFERFYRINKSGSREEGGSGLGLAIVKHIIEAHNEKIFVQSTYKEGSEFSFTLKNAK